MSRRTVFVVLLLVAMLIATPLEVLSEGKFQEAEPEEAEVEPQRVIYEVESTFLSKDGQMVPQTEQVWVDEDSNITSLEDLGVSSMGELYQQHQAISEQKAETQTEAETLGCYFATAFSSPWRVQGTKIAAARSQVVRGHGCRSRIIYDHDLKEKLSPASGMGPP